MKSTKSESALDQMFGKRATKPFSGFSINAQDLPIERAYRALWDKKEIGIVHEVSERLAARRFEKVFGGSVRFDIGSPRFEIKEL